MSDLKWTPVKVRLGQIKPWIDNPRMSTKAQAERLIQSERELGQVQTVAIGPVEDDGLFPLYDGHQRYSAWYTVKGAAYELTALQSNRPLSEDERRKMAILLHTASGGWSWEKMAGWSVSELKEWGLVNQENVKGWNNDANNVKEILKAEESESIDAEPQIDRAAELLEKWQVKTGDLWQIGEHRLICGDCTDAAVVGRVMGGEKADVLFTSPPYAAQRDYEIGDFDWLGLMLGMSEQAIENMKDNASILVNLGLVHKEGRVDRYWDEWIDWMEDNAQPLYGWYVWDKLSGLMGDWKGRLAPAHEWIFHFAKQPRKANKTAATKYAENGVTHYKKDKVGLRGKDGTMNGFTSAGKEVNQTKVIDSVIRCQPQRGGIEGHPAPFSVAFAETLVEVYANISELVYEPFCGSGTTLVACQNLGRRGRAVEISPVYVAVTLQRMADAFPALEIKRLE